MVRPVPEGAFQKWYVSCDYGTVNPTSMGLWGLQGGVWYRVKEFYFDSRARQRQMTDEEYAQALAELVGGRKTEAVIVDPSAASFIEVLRRKGWRVRKADNDVLTGIRLTSDALKAGRIVICEGCTNCIREMDEYVWIWTAAQKTGCARSTTTLWTICDTSSQRCWERKILDFWPAAWRGGERHEDGKMQNRRFD